MRHVLSIHVNGSVFHYKGSEVKVVSLGTGSKCIGGRKMDTQGESVMRVMDVSCMMFMLLCKQYYLRTGWIVNDSHSEVIARRGFMR